MMHDVNRGTHAPPTGILTRLQGHTLAGQRTPTLPGALKAGRSVPVESSCHFSPQDEGPGRLTETPPGVACRSARVEPAREPRGAGGERAKPAREPRGAGGERAQHLRLAGRTLLR